MKAIRIAAQHKTKQKMIFLLQFFYVVFVGDDDTVECITLSYTQAFYRNGIRVIGPTHYSQSNLSLHYLNAPVPWA